MTARRLGIAALGLLTIWPLIWIGLMIALVFSVFGGGSIAMSVTKMAVFRLGGPISIATKWLYGALMAGYGVMVLDTPQIPKQLKVPVLLATVFIGPLAMPSIWYALLWRRPPSVGESAA